MNFKLLVNGVEKKVSQITLEKVSQIITTKNPTEGVALAASVLGKGDAQAYLAAFQAAGEPTDTFEIQHETGKNEYTWKGRALRQQLVNKMTYALNPQDWMSELPEGETTERQAKDKGEPEVI